MNLQSQNPQLDIRDLLLSTTKGFNSTQWNKLLSLIMAMQGDIATGSSESALIRLLDTSINISPTISLSYSGFSNTLATLTYTGLTGTFTPGETITDANGSTAVIATDNGSNSMTVNTIVFTIGHTAFSGTITGSISAATATANVTTLNPFQVGEVITDSNGSTANISTVSGSSMTLTNLVLAAGHTTIQGTITGGTSHATATAVLFSWGEQIVNLAGGTEFAEVNPIMISTGGSSVTARDMEIWSGAGRTGTRYFSTNVGGTDPLSYLNGTTSFIDANDMLVPSPKQVLPSMLFITFGTPNTTALSARIIFTGIIVN